MKKFAVLIAGLVALLCLTADTEARCKRGSRRSSCSQANAVERHRIVVRSRSAASCSTCRPAEPIPPPAPQKVK